MVIMKKLFLLAVAAFAGMTANADPYTLNNPIGADGRYIVKYDCANGAFAAANDMMVDETFVFAIDIKGTWLEDFVKGTPTAEGASRGIAVNNWTGYGDTNGDFRRLKQINGTIWGMTCNFKQVMVDEKEAPKAVMADSATYVYAQIFCFEYTADNPGAGWWMWNDNPVDVTQAPGSDCLFAFPAYEAGHTSPELYADDYPNGDIYGFTFAGYAAPCLESPSAVENVAAEKNAVKVVENGQIILIHNGVRYNMLGAVVK